MTLSGETTVGVSARVDAWLEELERRVLEQVTFAELARSIRALSTWYVEKRDRLGGAQVFGGAGKRAAFAAYYGPLHFFLLRKLAEELSLSDSRPLRIVDLGCGTGVAGAACALAFEPPVEIVACDANPWATKQAGWTYARLGLSARVSCTDLLQIPLGGVGTTIVAAFAVNELPEAHRARLLERLRHAVAHGAHALVVEPIARASVPWWDSWARTLTGSEGGSRQWRWPAVLPDWLKRLDHAAHLHHDTLTCRSLSV